MSPTSGRIAASLRGALCVGRGCAGARCAVCGAQCVVLGVRCAVRGVRCAVWSAKLSFCGFCLWAERASQHRGVEGQCRSLGSWVLQLFWHMSTVLRLLSHALVRPQFNSAECSFSWRALRADYEERARSFQSGLQQNSIGTKRCAKMGKEKKRTCTNCWWKVFLDQSRSYESAI